MNAATAPTTAAEQTPPAEPATDARPRGVKAAYRTWLGFIRDPLSINEALILCTSARPGRWRTAASALLFILLIVLPSWANAPLLWIARRPTEPADAPARDTDGERSRIQKLLARARGWWPIVAEPMSVDVAWRESMVVHDTRIPDNSETLGALWLASNRTDRVLLFALLPITPTCLVGALLWCTLRPTRRYGLIAAVLVLIFVLINVAGS